MGRYPVYGLDNCPMLFKAGLISLILLVTSRLLGLVRESAQAAAFGVSATGDVAVLMLTLPDWLASLVAGGALAYVLLPHWSRQGAAGQAQTQRRVATVLLAGGVGLALVVAVFAEHLVSMLVPGLPPAFTPLAVQGLGWSAAALPAAMLAALWVTRLQHERDFVGMYAANLVVNGVLVLCLWALAYVAVGEHLAWILGAALGVAMVLRLLWLRWRLRKVAVGAVEAASHAIPAPQSGLAQFVMPKPQFWVWAALASGLPLALPFAARSLASASGEGALASFNYAWKLVELPLVLAIQLTATLAFPVITRAFASDEDPSIAVRRAFALSWTLACAAVVALSIGGPAIASLLFGWGRMDAQGLDRIALWAQAGAWSLLPQSLIAVALTVLATQGRLAVVALAYALGLAVLLYAGTTGPADGLRMMHWLNGVLTVVALITLALLGRSAVKWLPVRAMVVSVLALVGLIFASAAVALFFSNAGMAFSIALSACAALLTIAITWLGAGDLRVALRR